MQEEYSTEKSENATGKIWEENENARGSIEEERECSRRDTGRY